MAWTYTDNYNLLPNLYIRSHFNNGVLSHYQIYPCSGYVLWIPYLDQYEYDDEGNLVLDGNGDPIFVSHFYSWGGATAMATYDFVTNPNEYQAVLYEQGMGVYGNPIVTEIM